MSEKKAEYNSEMNHLTCPNKKCGEYLDSLPEAVNFPDATYTETCPYCFEDYSYVVKDGAVSLWEPPKNVRQQYNGTGQAGGKNGTPLPS